MKFRSVSTRLPILLPAVVLCATAFLAASSWTLARADAPLPPSESRKSASAPRAPEVGNFSLLDQKGRFHELRRVDGARAVVLMIAGNGCPVVRQNANKLKALRDKFPQVQFWMLNANSQDDRASIVEESNEFEFGVPVLKDETQMVASSLGVKRTAEVVAISAMDWTVFYRGALDDQMVQGAVKAAVREPYLENALRAFLDGKEVAPASTMAAGCLVHYDFTGSEPVSYARQVAPILESKCVSCHSTGNIGPFAMSSYAKVKGFSDQIREEILTQRMPPGARTAISGFSKATAPWRRRRRNRCCAGSMRAPRAVKARIVWRRSP